MKVDGDALRRGDPEACRAVYHAHLKEVMTMLQCGFVYYADGQPRPFHVRSAFDREELCQEAFSQFFRQCQEGRFDPSRPIKPYLRRIVINLALKNVRKLYREVTIPDPIDGPSDVSPQAEVEKSEVAELMREFRAGLADEDRTLIDLYAQDECSQRVVGERMGLSRDQVYRKLSGIRRAARKFLQDRGWLDES